MNKKLLNKTTVLYDGDCSFCIRWARYLKTLVKREDACFFSYQSHLRYFPELNEFECQKSIQVIEASGEITSGAKAIFRLLREHFLYKVFYFLYKRFSFFSRFSEKAYSKVAQNRKFFSRILKPPKEKTYQKSAAIFLQVLGFVYVVAFASIGQQILALYGQKGILPIDSFLRLIEQNMGIERWVRFPSLFWISSSDFMLQFICGVGILAGILLLLKQTYRIGVFLPWLCYLSLVSVGRVFMSFQWDTLLLETGFLAIFLTQVRKKTENQKSLLFYSKKVIFLFQLLLFRLMFLSGYVKLASRDASWSKLEALFFHYQTQPLPNPLSWYFHHLPMWFHQISVAMVLVIELVIPFFIFGPRILRRTAGVIFISFQILISLSGNYTFFNLLTIGLCLFLIDDEWLKKLGLKRKKEKFSACAMVNFRCKLWRGIKVMCFVFFLVLNAVVFSKHFFAPNRFMNEVYKKTEILNPLHFVNSYGLFAVMTTERNEIIIEGSLDGVDWKAYEFKYKPGNLSRTPPWIAPFQPRLDWQMWFAALSNVYRNPWLVKFMELLADKDPETVKLMGELPFQEKPRYLRAQLYEYRFSDKRDRKRGKIWERKFKGSYIRTVKLSQ